MVVDVAVIALVCNEVEGCVVERVPDVETVLDEARVGVVIWLSSVVCVVGFDGQVLSVTKVVWEAWKEAVVAEGVNVVENGGVSGIVARDVVPF